MTDQIRKAAQQALDALHAIDCIDSRRDVLDPHEGNELHAAIFELRKALIFLQPLITDKQIKEYCTREFDADDAPDPRAFILGVRFAEHHHKIGV